MSDLSNQQKGILRWLLNQVRYAEQHYPELLEKGIWWGISIEDKASENSRRASMCRALARLEKRGLLTRVKGRKKARTSRVLLTAEGRKVAEAMTGY